MKYAKRIARVEIVRLMNKFALHRDEMAIAIRRFHSKAWSAKRRGIPFFFTFEMWLDVWMDSGHYFQYGGRADDYCMARGATKETHDTGVYEPSNVRIITNRENNTEGTSENKWNVGRKHSKAMRKKVSQSLIGNKRRVGVVLSQEHKDAISRANVGNKNALGHRWTDEERVEIGNRAQEAWARRKRMS